MDSALSNPVPILPATVTQERIKLYLAYLETSGRKRYSAIRAGMEPNKLWRHRKQDTDLQELEAQAMKGYAELLEGEAHRRAVDGVKKGIYFRGDRVGEEIVYSDALLTMLLKANDPKFRNQGEVDVNVKAGVLVVQQSINPDDWEKEYGKVRTEKDRSDCVSVQPEKAGSDEAN